MSPSEIAKEPVAKPLSDIHLSDADEMGVLAYFIVLSRHRVVLLAITLGAGLLSGIVGIILPKSYRSETTIVSASLIAQDVSTSGLDALQRTASRFGLGSGSEASDSASPLYPVIVESRDFLFPFLARRYALASGDSVSLLHFLISDSERDGAVDRAIENLREDVLRIELDAASGATVISANCKDPKLASELSNQVADKLAVRILEIRREFAGQKVMFIRRRLEEVQLLLHQAEEELKSFRETNRLISNSPALLLDEGRLSRQVQLHTSVFIELTKQKELAEIQSAQTIPEVIILDRAVPSRKSSNPTWARFVLTGLILGGFLGLAVVASRDIIHSLRRSSATLGTRHSVPDVHTPAR